MRAVNGSDYDTWHSGRFLEEWTEEWIVKSLGHCFARYDKEDLKQALLSTMNLFRRLAVKAAESFQYGYPKEADKYAANWVKEFLF